MAVYKLGDICSLKKGKGNFYKRHLNVNGTVYAYHYGELYKHNIINEWKTAVDNKFLKNDNFVEKSELLLIDVSETFDEIGHVIYNNFDKGLIGNHLIHLYNFKNVSSKYLFYYLYKNQQLFKSVSYGDKVASLKISDIENLQINIPSISEQEKIIEIIKPFEDIIGLSNTLMDLIINLENKLLNFNTKITGSFIFEKGRLPENGVGTTPFLNVAAANGNINRFVSNKPNIFVGDVTISLDGNCGLVNNDLEGYNGYLYKVTSEGFEPWEVYYSLKTKQSQQIILLNETGTTIKHATGAKKELQLYEFEYWYYLKELFDLRIQLSMLTKNISNIKNSIINLLIK